MLIDTDILKETIESLFREKIKSVKANEGFRDKVKESLSFSMESQLGDSLHKVREFEEYVEQMIKESNGHIKIGV